MSAVNGDGRGFETGWTLEPDSIVGEAITFDGKAHHIAVDFPVVVLVVECRNGITAFGQIPEYDAQLTGTGRTRGPGNDAAPVRKPDTGLPVMNTDKDLSFIRTDALDLDNEFSSGGRKGQEPEDGCRQQHSCKTIHDASPCLGC